MPAIPASSFKRWCLAGFKKEKSRGCQNYAKALGSTHPRACGGRGRPDLSLLQGCHAAAEHSAAVSADLQEQLSVVATASVLSGLHDQRQRSSINDQAIVLHVCRQSV